MPATDEPLRRRERPAFPAMTDNGLSVREFAALKIFCAIVGAPAYGSTKAKDKQHLAAKRAVELADILCDELEKP